MRKRRWACLCALLAVLTAPPQAAGSDWDRYDPPIEITLGRMTNSSFKFVEGESFHHNLWNEAYLDRLGIRVRYDFIVEENQYDARVNVCIASDDLPDILKVSAKSAQMLAENGLIHDITETFAQHASPMLRGILESSEMATRASLINGRLMGIPVVGAVDINVPVIWIRSDWMRRLGLDMPRSVDELIALAAAFSSRDPDGNGLDDTYGIAINKSLEDMIGDARGLMNMFGAYKGLWMEAADGTLAYSSIQPEMKAALARMAQLYAQGILDPEFAVKDVNRLAEDIVQEKVGIQIGQFWNPAWPFADLREKNPEADWVACPLLASADGRPSYNQASTQVDWFFVVSRRCAHPEALIRLANFDLACQFGESASEWAALTTGDKYRGIQTFKYAVVGISPPTINIDMYTQEQQALRLGDPGVITLQAASNEFARGIRYLNGGDPEGWSAYKIRLAEDCSMGAVKHVIDNGLVRYNQFFGLPGPVAIERLATLQRMEADVFTRIIMNAEPVDAFDTFVHNWLNVGGAALTREVNAWHEAVRRAPE